MPACVDGTQHVVAHSEDCAISYLIISDRRAFATKCVNWNVQTRTQLGCPTNMIGVSMRNEYPAQSTTFCACLHNSVQVRRIVICWINHRRPFRSSSQHYCI